MADGDIPDYRTGIKAARRWYAALLARSERALALVRGFAGGDGPAARAFLQRAAEIPGHMDRLGKAHDAYLTHARDCIELQSALGRAARGGAVDGGHTLDEIRQTLGRAHAAAEAAGQRARTHGATVETRIDALDALSTGAETP